MVRISSLRIVESGVVTLRNLADVDDFPLIKVYPVLVRWSVRIHMVCHFWALDAGFHTLTGEVQESALLKFLPAQDTNEMAKFQFHGLHASYLHFSIRFWIKSIVWLIEYS